MADSEISCCCLVPYILDSAPNQRFRWEQWAPLLKEREVHLEFVPFETPELERARRSKNFLRGAIQVSRRYVNWLPNAIQRASDSDVAVVARNAAISGPPVAEYLIKHLDCPIVYDLDDAIHLGDQNESNPVKKLVRCNWRVGKISSWATAVTPGNEYLADYVGQFNDNVEILPTTISTDEYKPTPVVHDDRKPIVGWTGSQSTGKYLRNLLPVLEELQKTHDFEVLVMGADLDLGDVDGTCVPWSANQEVSTIQNMDIGLMPLPDNRWTRGKCALKALQYLAVGSPAVVSDVGMNRRAVPDGECGYVVDTEDEWLDALGTLLEDESLRKKMGRAGRTHLEENFSARAWVPTVESILRDAATEEDYR